jgi:hypothetical protein
MGWGDMNLSSSSICVSSRQTVSRQRNEGSEFSLKTYIFMGYKFLTDIRVTVFWRRAGRNADENVSQKHSVFIFKVGGGTSPEEMQTVCLSETSVSICIYTRRRTKSTSAKNLTQHKPSRELVHNNTLHASSSSSQRHLRQIFAFTFATRCQHTHTHTHTHRHRGVTIDSSEVMSLGCVRSLWGILEDAQMMRKNDINLKQLHIWRLLYLRVQQIITTDT